MMKPLTSPILLSLIFCGIDAQAALIPEANRKPAPDFSLKDEQGRIHKLTDFRGKTLLVNFWATWCVPCKVEMPWFNDFDKQYRERTFAVIGVSLDEEGWKVVTPYLRSTGINYLNLLGDDNVASQWGGVDSLPQSFLIDAQGRIAAKHVGLTDRATFEAEIEELIANRTGAKPSVSSVANGASYKSGLSAGMWTTITGTNLSRKTRSWSGGDFAGDRLPTQLDGVSVTINGKAAFVAYISPNQINVLTPDDRSTGPVIAVVANGSQTSDPFSVTMQPRLPGLFGLPFEAGRYVAAHFQDGVYAGPEGLSPGLRTRPAKAGDTVTLYGTGFGGDAASDSIVTTPRALNASLQFQIGGVPAEVKYAGLVSNGLYQFNVVVPAVPEGAQSVIAIVDGVASPTGPRLMIGR